MENNEPLRPGQEDVAPLTCPYMTNIITIRVADTDKEQEFFVHSGVLSQSADMFRQLNRCIFRDKIYLSMEPKIFELLLSFLYTGDYKVYSSFPNPVPECELSDHSELEAHTVLYYFASLYKLNKLRSLTIENIHGMGQVPFINVLFVARQVYHEQLGDDPWYRNYFKKAAGNAIRERTDLIQEHWMIEAFEEEKGRLIVDLITGLAEGLNASKDAAENWEPGTLLTPGTSIADDTPCEFRAIHLASLMNAGPWSDCFKCRYEWDQIQAFPPNFGSKEYQYKS